MNTFQRRVGAVLVLAAGFIITGMATATPITMDFDGLAPLTSVDDYYDGGCTKFLSFPVNCHGPEYGVQWNNAVVIAGATTPSIGGPYTVMSVANGFDTQLLFRYATTVPGYIAVYGDVDGHRTLLASQALQSTALSCSSLVCWQGFSLDFSGVGKSAVFWGFPIDFALDDVTISPVDPVGVPEPATLGMFGLGALLIGLLVVSRRRPSGFRSQGQP